MNLTPDQKRFYQDNGYLAVENLIPSELAVRERERIAWLCAHWDGAEAARLRITHEPGLPRSQWSRQTVRGLYDLTAHEEMFREHALHPSLINCVVDLIGKPIALFNEQALLKPPSVGSPKPPHQDNAYFQVQPVEALITCWCALDDATIENGCMQYVPGSHKRGLLKHTHIAGTTHQVPDGFDPAQAVAVPIRAGGVIFHHGLTLHLSGENRSKNWRRTFVCHFVRQDADLSKSVTVSSRLLPVTNESES